MQRASITLAISRRIVIHAIVVAATASAVVVGAFFGFPRVVGGAIEVLVPIKDDGRRAWFTGHPAACLRRPFRRFAVLARGAPVTARQGPVIAALVRLPTRDAIISCHNQRRQGKQQQKTPHAGGQPLRAAAMGAAAVGGQSKNQQGCPDAFLTTATAAMGIISSTKGAAAPILTTD